MRSTISLALPTLRLRLAMIRQALLPLKLFLYQFLLERPHFNPSRKYSHIATLSGDDLGSMSKNNVRGMPKGITLKIRPI